MPKDLAALLVEEGAAPADAVKRALERQREAGGALDTALLEAGAISEERLAPFLARASELPLAPEGAWTAADVRARRVFPSRVAERHGLAPFALDGRELSLVATHPVDVGLLDEISFMLSLHLTAHVGPEWRVRVLIHNLYGTPLPPRLAALAAAAGVATSVESSREPNVPPQPPPLTWFERDEGEPLEPLAAALAQAIESLDLEGWEEPPVHGEPGTAGGTDTARPPPDRSAPPRWGLEEARAALAAAQDRDEVVLAALRYARDFFEFAAFFAVTRDAVAGHDALGADRARERARALAVWSADPGIARTVIETRSPYLGPVSRDAPGNQAILSGLGRETPRTALVFPIALRERIVALLYADNGQAPVSPRRLGDLLLLLSGLGAGFERIIRARKWPPRRTLPVKSDAVAAPPPGAPSISNREGPEPATTHAEDAEGAAASEQRPAPSDGVAANAPAQPPRAETSPAAPESESTESESPELAERFGQGPEEATSLLEELERQFFGDDLGATAAEPSKRAEAEAGLPAAAPESPAAEAPKVAAPGSEPAVPEGEALTPAALTDRALDSDPSVASAACDSLAARRRDPELRAGYEKLRRALLSGMAMRAARAAGALGALRDVEAIPLLVQVMETSEPEPAQAAADALARITLQQFGTNARKWLAWWKRNRGRGRAEWLFSGLTSADRETRATAEAELREAAADAPIEYSPDMPTPERERAARAWAGWWARSGHVLL